MFSIAHNIEDSSRSAGSFEVDENTLMIISKELDQIIRHGVEMEAHGHLQVVIDQLREWIISSDLVYTTREYENHYCHWTGADIISKLNDVNITSYLFESHLKLAYKTAAGYAEMVRKEAENQNLGKAAVVDDESSSQVEIHRRKCLSNNSLTVIQGIFMVLGLLFEKDKNYADDYQMVVSKRIERSENITSGSESIKRRRRNDNNMPKWSFKLGFKCLNPGVIFKRMTESTRSVILTSGTLSPLNTFASELETSFEGRLEANHVIHKSQVWAGAIPRGPNQVQLKGVYSNMESFQYQDDIGESLCQIVEAVPFGVLCFMPSYHALDKFIQRWKTTGIHDRMLEKKMIICEPKGSDKKEFEKAINQFYTQIDDVELDIDEHGRDGALFFAVFRGKVSEGIDFTDNYCRAVVSIGIPYPGVKDMEVKFKKEYNDWKKAHKANSDILSGGAWYSAQAFRAINQALGRCIRHKNDWGAIILLEQRFESSKLCQGLSKWVRNQIGVYPEFPFAMSSLKTFVEEQKRRTSALTRNSNSPMNGLPSSSKPKFHDISTATIKSVSNSSSTINLPANTVPTSIIEPILTDQPEISTAAETSHNSSNLDTLQASGNAVSPFFPPEPPKAHPSLSTNPNVADPSSPNDPTDILPDVSDNDTSSHEPPVLFPANMEKQPPVSNPIPASIQTSHPQSTRTKIPEKIIRRNALLDLHKLHNVETHISCSLCKKPLMQGQVRNLTPVTMKCLRLISDNGDIKNNELVELCNPFAWITTENLIGGPIDTRVLPAQIEVILSFADGVCYRFIGCACSANRAIGVVICEATNFQGQQYKGRVFIWFDHLKVEREIEEQPPDYVMNDKIDIPSSQAPSMTDLFYSL